MAAKDTKKMEIHTCYTVKIKHQLDAVPDRKTKKLNISRKRRVDDRSMQQTKLSSQRTRRLFPSSFLVIQKAGADTDVSS